MNGAIGSAYGTVPLLTLSALVIVREAGGVVVDPTTGGEVDFLARCDIYQQKI